jgi:glycosyltransferase involved in cell wall biosynthesis
MVEQQGLDNDAFKEKVKQLGLENYVELHHGLPFAEMQNQMSACHAGLIAYGKDLGIDSLPNRFFEYMATGIPVIVPSFSAEMVKIVNQEKCGLLTDTENPKNIAESFELLINRPLEAEEMAERGRSAFLLRHNWEHEVAPLIHFMQLN